MESEENKISVWVCREEKLVLGLSKRTTCADVIKVLLEDQNSQQGLCAAQSYCIVEKWRGCERILPNKTRILRLWVAWGDEQRNVKFVLVKSEVSLDSHGARSAEARVVLSKQSPCIMKGTARCTVSSISPEKQRRIVRKAFRKLEKINKKRSKAARRDASCAEKMETLVHSVVSQDHTIRQQIQRITELDAEIERCEAKVHMDRIKRHGANYVQNTYLVDVAAASSHEVENLRSSDTLAKLEKYFRHREEVVRLQEELWEQETLIDVITGEIQDELNHRWMQRRKEELWKLLEEERIKTQLNASLYIGLRLNADLEAIRSDLELTEQICGEREREIRDLLEKVNTLGMEEGKDTKKRYSHGADVKTGMMSTLQRKNGWVEQARGLSKTHNVNDDDSDTGLSSLHSQDSDSLPVWESLV
uniref:Ras association domain family member 10 n=1 Tax=Pundamilia nyererei TaxID=303518 RepID=A0A3B4G4S9_9CICH